MARISAVTIATPDASELVTALTAISGEPATWFPAAAVDTGAEGRTCQIAGVEVFEILGLGGVQLPESITLTTTDAAGAVDRLRAAGFDLTEHTGLPVAASLTVAGVGIRIAAAT